MISKVAKIVSTALFLILWMTSTQAQELQRFSRSEPHLGTLVSLTTYCSDQQQFDDVSASFFTELERLNHIFSDYDSASEISKINQNHKQRSFEISPELGILLQNAREFADLTAGVLDPALGRLTHLWKRAFRKNKFPTKGSIRRAQRKSGYQLYTVDTIAKRLDLTDPCVVFDFGAMGKGYIGDLLSAMLGEAGATSHLIDLGGDLIAGAAPPGSDGWQIALVDGSQQILAHQAIATSGTSYQFLEHKGKRYSHLIDARTGYGLAEATVSTVVAKDGFTADAMASAMPFLSIVERQSLAQKLKFTYKLGVVPE